MGNAQIAPTHSAEALGPIPIVFGILGHRDPRPTDREALARELRVILLDFRARYPSTPFVVLSAMAEGCDWIGAHVALELGARLIAPLPMARYLFEHDFDSDEKRAEFAAILDRADDWFEIPHAEGVSHEEIRIPGPDRDYQYAAVGAYITRNTQIMIALWDGLSNGLVGGTSTVVRYRLEGLPPEYAPDWSPLDPVDNGPVYHIITPRDGRPVPDGALTTRVLFPPRYEKPEDGERAMRNILERIESFNHDAVATMDRLADVRGQSVSYLLPPEACAQLTRTQQMLLRNYAIADTMATFFQRKSRMTLHALFALVFVAIVFFELYAHLFSEHYWIIGLYLGSLAAAYWWSMIARRHDYQNKHLDYRALAEGMRVQIYWTIAGIESRAIDYYMRRQRSVLDWIREAMRAWYPDHIPDEAERIPLHERLRLVSMCWVESQLEYFRQTLKKDERELERKERYIDFFFITGLLVAVVQMFLGWGHTMVLAMGLLPAAAAMLHGYTEKRALAELTKQYERMGMIFVNAATYLRHLLDDGRGVEAQELVHEIGVEALTENGDWVLLHRERPVDVPKAG